VEKLSHGERSHDVVQNVHERATRRCLVEQPLNLGLRLTQGRAELLQLRGLAGYGKTLCH
jgi:hypothetical protein